MPKLNANVQHVNHQTIIEKERQAYVALSALVDFLQGQQRPANNLSPGMTLETFKRNTLNRTAKLKLVENNDSTAPGENQFNVMHYQRAILSASQENYRNMAILAAIHNLTPSALDRLVKRVKKACLMLSKEVSMMEKNSQYKQAQQPNNQRNSSAVVAAQSS